MTDYRKLDIKSKPVTEDTGWDAVPEQRAPMAPQVPPGRYEWELPASLEGLWETFDANIMDPKTSETALEQRVALQFTSEHPLVVVSARDRNWIGALYQGRISNAERNRARRGDPPQLASDMDFLLRDSLKHPDKPRRGDNMGYINAVNKYGRRRFSANSEWSAYCSADPKKPRYVLDELGQSVEDPDHTPGCGTRYYQGDIPKAADGSYSERLTCTCGASLRCFANLTNFGPPAGGAEGDVPY